METWSDDAAQLEFLKELAATRGQSFFVHYGIDLEAWAAGDLVALDHAIDQQLKYCKQLPLPVAQFIVQKGLHRFRDRCIFNLRERLWAKGMSG